MRGWVLVAMSLGLLGCRRTGEQMQSVLPPEGAPVPAFEYPGVTGGAVRSSALVGRPTVLALWSSTCTASRAALAAMASLRQQYAAQDMNVLIIAADTDAAVVQAVLDSAGLQIPVALAGSDVERRFAPGRRWPWEPGLAWPSFLVLDADGDVRYRIVGIEQDEADRFKRVRQALEAMRESSAADPGAGAES